jgi:hypothetical protein
MLRYLLLHLTCKIKNTKYTHPQAYTVPSEYKRYELMYVRAIVCMAFEGAVPHSFLGLKEFPPPFTPFANLPFAPSPHLKC